jgi:AraC-like DNA-binding protein
MRPDFTLSRPAGIGAPNAQAGVGGRIAGCEALRIALRIARACRLLEDPSADIAAVALECGYESLSQFYARFGHIMGVPPGRYRRRLRD